jgi:hypothetical protein
MVPAPVRGWIANENLANATEGGAAVLENWFPTATGLRIRAGSELYATLGDGTLPVRSLFSYLNGVIRKFFGATDEAIYDITTIVTPMNYALADDLGELLETDTGDTFGEDSTIGKEVLVGTTSGNWVVVQFATAGGVFLVGVNGEDDAFLYDGADFFPISGEQIYRLDYDAETVPFTAGATLTGGTSAATATILRVFDEGSGVGHLWIQGIAGGPFDDNEIITDSDGGSATADGDEGAPIAPSHHRDRHKRPELCLGLQEPGMVRRERQPERLVPAHR